MRKLFKIALTAAALSAAMTIAAFADGWTVENNNWVYYQNGSRVTNEWKTSSDGGYYYLDSSGYMATNTFVDDERYVGSDGRMVAASWRQIDSKWYYFDQSGKIVKDKSKQINGVYYFFDDMGAMATGWVQDSQGNWYYCDLSDGHSYTSTWKNLVPPDAMNIDDSTSDVFSRSSDGSYWFYFQSTGKIYTATNSTYKEYTISGNRYAFDTYGRMMTGWVKLNDTTPEIAGYKYYNDDTSIGPFGAAHTGWLSVMPPETDGTASLGSEVAWYYFDTKGTPYCGSDVSTSDDDETLLVKLKRITKNGKTYTFLFNQYGNPVYGLRKVQRTDGTQTSMYFGTKEQSCLQLGETSITEADGTKWPYHYETNGYGTNGVKNGKLYYMGKLQKAIDNTYAYYTVNGTTYLVNKSGAVVKNHNSKKDPGEVDYRSNSAGIKDGGTSDAEELLAPQFNTTDIS
ncbi:MAG: cell wall-binding protein [Eubacteriales bacterium]|nr:cell wall-binding protein [Eubacteriales bacterium]